MEKIDIIMKNLIDELDYKPLSDMFSNISSGKKLRSKLILKISNQSDEAYKLCAIIELIHAASLLHDDVIDESELRRGKASINAIFGAKNAVMLGDILYSKAYFELSKFDPFIARTISDAVCKLSIGELMDVELSRDFNADIDKYMQMLYYKTAILIEASAKCAAFLAKKSKEEIENFAIYGKNLGIAFQIIDDILDITQTQATLGKPSLNDFKEGKTTIAYIKLFKILDLKEKELLKSYFKKELDDTQKEWIKSKFEENNIIKKCVDIANSYGKKAIDSIKEFKNDELEEIVTSMIDRKF